jgi:hypothetical protein
MKKSDMLQEITRSHTPSFAAFACHFSGSFQQRVMRSTSFGSRPCRRIIRKA